MGIRVRWLTAAFVLFLGVAFAAAADRPIDGVRLVLKRTASASTLTFVSRDPDFLFPPVGGADDPATGTPGGATVELFSQAEGQASLALPAGAGNPGWAVVNGPPARYRFRNGAAPAGISPVRVMVLKDGRVLKIVAKDAGLPLAMPQGAVGIRITTGTLRNCARFAGATIRRDVAGAFVASHASSTALPSCSDGSMNGQPECGDSSFPFCGGTCPGGESCGSVSGVCQCLPASTPCGQTSPACGGTCAAGEQCASVGPGPLPECVCIPVGSTPCGNPGAPTCGGACPGGTACKPIITPPSFGAGLGCTCADPGDCGQGGVDCPNGFACAAIPPGASCVPIPCGGSATYPTCGGTCVSGAACQPLKANGASPPLTICLCAVPAPCDVGCGGYTCTGGDVCTVETSPSVSCSCGAP